MPPLRRGDLQPGHRAAAMQTIVAVPHLLVVLLLGSQVGGGQQHSFDEVHSTRLVGHSDEVCNLHRLLSFDSPSNVRRWPEWAVATCLLLDHLAGVAAGEMT